VSCGVPAVLPSIRCGARTRPSAAAGALVTKFAAAAHFARSHFPRARHLPLVAASARVLHKIGLPGAARVVRSQPCALRMHAKADTNSHGRIPTRACGDLPHWRSTIRSKDGQYLILPRGAAFEAISGEGHRILLVTGAAAQPDLAGNAQCHFIAGAALPTKTYYNAPLSAGTGVLAAFAALGSSSAPRSLPGCWQMLSHRACKVLVLRAHAA